MKKLTIVFSAALAVCAAFAEDTAIGTIVLEENFADYASIINGTITIQGQSITPKVNETTNAQLSNSLAKDTSAKTATVTIGGTAATVYTSDGVALTSDTSAGTVAATVGTSSATVYSKSKTDTLLSGKVGTGTTVAGKALSSNVTLDSLTFGSKAYNGNGAKTITAADISAVPTTTKVNGKALSGDITLSASDVSALPATTTHTTADVALANVKVNSVAITSATVLELGNTYILFTTANGKTTATLYSRQ